jgi:hypothetical protein
MTDRDFLKVLVNLYGDDKESLIEDFQIIVEDRQTNIAVSETLLQPDAKFRIQHLYETYESNDKVLEFLYENDSHELLFLLTTSICENTTDVDLFKIDSYNYLHQEEYSDTHWDYYGHMSEISEYQLETRNLVYRFKYCVGGSFFDGTPVLAMKST